MLTYDLLFRACSLKWHFSAVRGVEKGKSVTKNSLASLWPPDVVGNKQTLHKSRKYSVSINVCLVPCHRSANFSLLITPPVISLTPCQPLPNPWYRLYS